MFVTGQYNISVTEIFSMSALLEFECRVPVDGYRVLSFDERKFDNLEEDPRYDEPMVYPPDGLTDDEQYLFNKWKMQVVPIDQWRLRGVPFWSGLEIERQLKAVFEPNSERTNCFDLFDETSTPFLDFANAPDTIDGAKALIDRFGPLLQGPQFYHNWWWARKEMRSAVAAWEKAKTTGNFGRVIQMVRLRGKKNSEKHPESGVDASVTLREDSLTGQARLCIRPTTLLDALWTKLALAIDGSEALLTCIECKRWFTINVGQGRSDKKYCSNACRMRAYRKRKGTTN
jgi:hypothetical protein